MYEHFDICGSSDPDHIGIYVHVDTHENSKYGHMLVHMDILTCIQSSESEHMLAHVHVLTGM